MPVKVQTIRFFRTAALVGVLAGASALLGARTVRADEPGINPTGKGITGGVLLGAELVTTVEAAAGVRPPWAYFIGIAVGGGGGAAAGYFVEQGSDPRPAYYMMAAGMALFIPATVAVLQATSYKAPAEYTEDRPGHDTTPATEPPRPAPPSGETTPETPAPAKPEAPAPTKPETPGGPSTKADPSRTHLPVSLVDLHQGTWRLGLPLVEVRPMYSVAEVRKYGVEQRMEIRLPLLQATF